MLSVGFPQFYWSGIEGEYFALVMNMMGPNLMQLFDFCQSNFSLKTVLMIALQLIDRLEWMHSKNFVHRDIKPENILIGHGKRQHLVNLIDFGLSKRFINPQTGLHIVNKKSACVIGTIKFLSASTHDGYEHGRRDDLEAIGNVLIYFLKKGKEPGDAVKMPLWMTQYIPMPVNDTNAEETR